MLRYTATANAVARTLSHFGTCMNDLATILSSVCCLRRLTLSVNPNESDSFV